MPCRITIEAVVEAVIDADCEPEEAQEWVDRLDWGEIEAEAQLKRTSIIEVLHNGTGEEP